MSAKTETPEEMAERLFPAGGGPAQYAILAIRARDEQIAVALEAMASCPCGCGISLGDVPAKALRAFAAKLRGSP